MQKKVFLRKGGGQGGGGRPPYVKYLLLAILGLSVAIVAASYLLNPKNKDNGRKTISDKPTVKKELPRPPEPTPSELPAAEKLAGVPDVKPQPAPEPPKQPEPLKQPEPPKQPEPAPKLEPPPPLPPQPVQPQPTQPQAAKPVEPAPKDIFPKSPVAPSLTQKAPPAASAEKKVQKKPVKPSLPGPAEPGRKAVKATPKDGMFVVKLGPYKEKQSAEEVRQRLQKKGYDMRSCPSGLSGRGAYAYSIVTRPANKSKAYSLAEQLKTEKVNPSVVAASAACGMDAAALKAAMKKPVSKTQVKPASATPKSKAAATPKANGAENPKTIKKQAATVQKPKPAAGNNSVPAAPKPGTTPAKANSTQ